MSRTSKKKFPPIIYILFAGILWFAGRPIVKFTFQSINGSDNSPEIIKRPGKIAHFSKRFSSGEKLLITANATTEKKQGVTAFALGQYLEAINYFNQSLKQYPNDPETVIYRNNAQIPNNETFKIAVVVPIGSNLDVAQEMLQGIAQAQTEFNTQGGNLHIQIVNDENNTQIAEQVAKELVKDKSILAVIGSNASNASLAAAPIYQKHGLVMITPTSTSGALSNFGNYIFRTAPTNAEMADTLAEYVVKQAKRKNVAVCFASEAPDNVTFKDEFIPALTAQGGNYINTECDLSAPDFNGENAVNNLISSGAEAVLIAPHIDKLNRAIDLARANQWKMLLLGTFSLNTSKITNSGQGDLNGVVLPVPFHQDMLAAQSFAQQAQEMWEVDLTWRTATSYDAIKAIALALENSPTRSGIKNTLRNSNFSLSGANGKVQFLPSGDRTFEPALVKVKANPERGYYFELLSE